MSKTPRESNTVTVVGTAEGPVAVPTWMQDEDLGALAGAGVSDRAQDFALPFLAIAQSNSPQVDEMVRDKYIEGLRVGDIFNTATRRIWKGHEGVAVVPVWFQKSWVEWIPRNAGGGGGKGYIATYDIDDPIVERARWRDDGTGKKLLMLPSGHQLVETAYHFVLDVETGSPLVVPMTSTGLQCSRMWQTFLKDTKVPHQGSLIIAPCFARSYLLTAVYKSNDSGKWYTWSVSPQDWARPALYQAGKAFFVDAQQHGVQLGRPPIVEDESEALENRDVPI